jgi:hypothetical protein
MKELHFSSLNAKVGLNKEMVKTSYKRSRNDNKSFSSIDLTSFFTNKTEQVNDPFKKFLKQ